MSSLRFYLIAGVLLFLIFQLLSISMRDFFRFIKNSLLGGVIIVIFNFLGAYLGLEVALSLINAILVGYLGIPGVFVLLIFQLPEFQLLGSLIRDFLLSFLELMGSSV